MDKIEKIFTKIYDQYIDKIYRFVFIKVSSEEIAQDLTSETFLRTWESFKQGNKIDNPQAFLYRVARNLVTDHYREKAKIKIVSAETNPIIDPRENLEETVAIKSDLDSIKLRLADLKEDYQNVIILRYINDLSIKEVAKTMDRTDDAIRVLLHRALQSLREKMNKNSSIKQV